METPTIQGKRVKLRPLAQSDLERLTQIMGEPTVKQWWHEEDWQKEYIEAKDRLVWAIEFESRMQGLIQAYEDNDPNYRHAAIDISISSEIQGQGLGVEALKLVAKFLFAGGHHRLVIDPAAANERAIKAYEKAGFKPVGVMRQYERNTDHSGWHDGLLMDMLKEEFIDA